MHPYEMQRTIRDRGKDDLLDLKPGSLYHAIERMERGGLIEAVDTSREGRRPERTTYRITEAGVDVLLEWMYELVSHPTRDSNEFLAAIAHLPHLQPDEAAKALESRALMLEAEIASLDSVFRALTPRIGPIVLLESDLARAWKQAELEWVRDLIEKLRTGVYHWDIEAALRDGAPIPGAPPGVSPGAQPDQTRPDEGGAPML
jgi:DNA-binding PadR family transcriptional regulator